MSRLNFIETLANIAAPEADTGLKNGRNPKSQMSRRSFFMIVSVVMLSSVFVLSGCKDDDDDAYDASIPTSQFTVLNIHVIHNGREIDFDEVRISAGGTATTIAPYSENGFSADFSNIIPPINILQNVVDHVDYKDKGLKFSKKDVKIGHFYLHAFQIQDNINRRIGIGCEEGSTIYAVSIWYSDNDVIIRGNHKSDDDTITRYNVSFNKGWNFRYQRMNNRYDTTPHTGALYGLTSLIE